MSTTSRLRLLLIAPGCDGSDVSESAAAFQWVRRLSQRHDVTLLTMKRRGRKSVADQLPTVELVEWQEPSLFAGFERFNSMLKPGYLAFYFQARRWIGRSLTSGRRWDVAHQITPLAPRYPSPAAGLGMPLILGPVGGCFETPQGMAGEVRGMPWFTKLRGLDGLRFRLDPWLRGSLRSADLVLCDSPAMREVMAAAPIKRTDVMCHMGVEQLPAVEPRRQTQDGLKLLYVGRIVRTKGLRDAIRAMATLSPVLRFELDVVGDGNDREACEKEAESLGIRSRLRFHGTLSREKIDSIYRQADVFLFPSFRETTGHVLLEAMSHGLPCITADHAGPSYLVDDSCGIRVAGLSPTQFAADLASAVNRLASSPGLRRAMSTAARERIVEHFLWDRKIERMEQLYSTLTNQSVAEQKHRSFEVPVVGSTLTPLL